MTPSPLSHLPCGKPEPPDVGSYLGPDRSGGDKAPSRRRGESESLLTSAPTWDWDDGSADSRPHLPSPLSPLPCGKPEPPDVGSYGGQVVTQSVGNRCFP
jgi:hypothetical protein